MYICKIPTLDELIKKQDYEMEHNPDEKENWLIWKKQAIERYNSKKIIPYYGFLDDKIICECTAAIDPSFIQNSDGLVDLETAYLFAFRTVEEYQGQGYFSRLFKFMIDDLKSRGYKRVTLGVEPTEEKNKQIYQKYGFTKLIKKAKEVYPDGTEIDVEYYGKDL